MNTETDMAKLVWNEAGIAELLGCTPEQVRSLALEGDLPKIRVQRGLYVFLAPDVLKWLEDKKSGQG
jgi:hypothetical protein